MIEPINVNVLHERLNIRCALFDFDGTLSLLREGWQEIMAEQMVDTLMQTATHEDATTLRPFVADLIRQTTGQQTIYQMIRLAKEVEKRGTVPESAQTYKQHFTDRLSAHIRPRLSVIQNRPDSTDQWLVPGTRALLELLCVRNIICYIASGTDEVHVRNEASALHIASYFAGIWGAREDYKNHSKKMVIQRLVEQYNLRPGELVTFGDGVPEIEDTKAVGGIAVGVASNEQTRSGINPHKRESLIAAGADMIIPDFQDLEELNRYLFAKE